MNTSFHLYSNSTPKSKFSIFDFIHGSGETKQTKGLAYLLSEDTKFCLNLFNKYCKLNLKTDDIESIKVIAEAFTKSNKRVDILVLITSTSNKYAFIIEAKEFNLSVNSKNLQNQIGFYTSHDELELPNDYQLKSIVLTKYKEVLNNSIISITWTDIILQLQTQFKKTKNKLVEDFFEFLTGISKSMNYYEQEVLSIPAGKTLDVVEQYYIYECPNTQPYNYKKSLYMCFRKSNGGEMDTLYKVREIIIIDRKDHDLITRLTNLDIEEELKDRIIEYIKDTKTIHTDSEEKKLYVLNRGQNIQLEHKPRPERNNAKFTYYSLYEILTNTIVKPQSKDKKS